MISFIANTIQIHIARLRKDEIGYEYLALQRSKSNPIYPNLWQTITGTIERNESAVECAIREVYEETGLELSSVWTIPFVAIFFDPYQNSIQASPVFGGLVLNEQVVRISSEHQAFEWLLLEEFMRRVPLPSHKTGAKYFWEYILSTKDKEMFKFRK
ncbi:MAG: NUDIX domain-containing protein [Candidatus Kapaibacteriales bacterium]